MGKAFDYNKIDIQQNMYCSSNARPSFMRLLAQLQIEFFWRLTATSMLV